jgi:uncharacterized membrane protein
MKSAVIVASALAMALSMSATQTTKAAEGEKCYGIAKAGKNDCKAGSHDCKGQSTVEADASSYIYVPVGTCEKIVGGNLTPKA